MMTKKTLMITSCDAYPGYLMAQWALKYRDHFENVICGGHDKDSSLMRDLHEMGAKVVEYDVKDENKLKEIFEKCDMVHVIPPVHHGGVKHAMTMLKACCKAGVDCVSLTSVLNCDRAKGHHIRQYHEVEECGKKMDLKHFCIIREGFWLDTFFCMSHELQHGRLPFPTKDGKFAPVAADDIYHGVMKGMMEKMESQRHVKMYELTGPCSVKGSEIAEKACEALHTHIKFEHVSMDKMREILRRSHHKKMHEAEIEVVLEMLEMIREGHLDKTTDDLKKLLDRKPMDVQEFFEKNEHEFRPR